MVDYTIFYKSLLTNDDWHHKHEWDLFLSGFTKAERVTSIFDKVNSAKKYWLIFPEFEYDDKEFPRDEYFVYPKKMDEGNYIINLFNEKKIGIDSNSKICVDITGFVRPYLAFLVKYFMVKGVLKFEALYSEPLFYSEREQTKFSDEIIVLTRQIEGYAGNHQIDMSGDLLIINSGYDDQQITQASEHKEHAKKIQIFGFPSLRADMYQENILRASLSEEAVGSSLGDELDKLFAPANDPFVTAQVLSDFVKQYSRSKKITNLYLCPIATKPQLLGCVIYYLWELEDGPYSIIYPFCESYPQNTSIGISRTWKYTIELPNK
jgi:hypothetical protein